MRIFLDDQAFHIETRGGVSRHMALLARSLSEYEDGPEVHLFAGWCHNRFALELASSPRLHVHRLPRPAGLRITGLARRISSLWRGKVAADLLRRPEPLVYHGSFYPLDPALARKAALTVCTIHDMIPEMRMMRGQWADPDHTQLHRPFQHPHLDAGPRVPKKALLHDGGPQGRLQERRCRPQSLRTTGP